MKQLIDVVHLRQRRPRDEYLQARWGGQFPLPGAIMQKEGKLDRLTREIIAVAVSAVMGCEY
jgi:alkylhydroperoxidase/carboxymuconolactone decarboxylase family protein YurZ